MIFPQERSSKKYSPKNKCVAVPLIQVAGLKHYFQPAKSCQVRASDLSTLCVIWFDLNFSVLLGVDITGLVQQSVR